MVSPIRLLILTCSLFFTLSTTSLTAQKTDLNQLPERFQEVNAVSLNPARSTASIIELGDLPKSQQNANVAPVLVQRYYGLKAGVDAVSPLSTTQPARGFAVNKYQRIHRGIPVEHERYNVLSGPAGPRVIAAEHYDLPNNLRTKPTLTRAAALKIALNYVGATTYAWEQIDQDYVRYVWSLDLVKQIDEELRAVQPGGELTIVDDYDTPEADPDLAWKFNVYASAPLSRAWIYVNAHSGKIMLKDRIIKHASEPVNVQTRYAGPRTIMVDLETSGTDPHNGLPLLDSRTNAPAAGPLYVLRDDTRGDGLETYDLNGVGGVPLSLPLLYAQGKAFTDDDLNWSLSEHRRGGTINEAENDDIAWDAHWGTQVVYDYWLDVHGRNSYDDNGIAIKSFLHYGVAYDNAFWNGTAMTYGDGSYQGGANPDGTFAPLMSLDVCGHEIGHAICTFTADLVYANESGAMNEGFSDIWGAAIEAYVARAVDPSLGAIMNPWGIGEQIDERDGGIQYPDNGWRALRYMDEPGRAGDPDTYGGANWVDQDCSPNLANDQCGVHTNSGVLNKWYYIITAGDAGTNDLGDNYAVNGLGFEVSERIAYGTELLLTPNATFAEARAASIAFVRNMTEAGGGQCGTYERVLTDAWFAVGVGEAFSCAQVASFTERKSFTSELVMSSNDCDAGKIITVEAAVVGSGQVSLGGNATEGEDYDVLNKFFSTGSAGFGVHNFQVLVYDDASIEGDETITLSLPGGPTHRLTIIDNDTDLSVGSPAESLLNHTMRASSLPPGWSVVTQSGGANSWFASVANGAQIGITAAGGATPTYDGNEQVSVDVILASPKIDARGMHSLQLSFDWRAGGETDVPTDVSVDGGVTAVPLDYGNLAYSFDGETWEDFPEYDAFVSILATVASGSFNEVLPDYLQGTQFYLGWRWRNDPLVGSAYSFSFENVNLNASHPGIATQTMATEEPLGPQETIYFLDASGTETIAKITNLSNHDFGCTSVQIVTSGTGKNRCSGGVFLDKTFRIVPERRSNNKPLEITWYVSDAEATGFENSSGQSMEDVVAYSSRSYVCATGSDRRREAEFTLMDDIEGGVAIFTSVRSGDEFFSLGMEDSSLPVLFSSFYAQNEGDHNQLNWATSQERDNEGFVVQRSSTPTDGFRDIGWIQPEKDFPEGTTYQFTDADIVRGETYYYRLLQKDFDGATHPTDIQQVSTVASGATISLYPNPTQDLLNVRVSEEDISSSDLLQVMDVNGKVVISQALRSQQTLRIEQLPNGIYLVRVPLRDGSTITRRVLKQ
ncbi:M4 family metallopeptidase [Lewinella sp. W8]|uniref:M4 family metallopeptidase n=1 Tax=Lewinella sp. W8 TaxID=2528208 RepID=UPI0015645809|nr:M4 family metallopeptidase [Lewinella sp. W8]